MTYEKKGGNRQGKRKGKRKGRLGITQYMTMREGGGEGPVIKICTKKKRGKRETMYAIS